MAFRFCCLLVAAAVSTRTHAAGAAGTKAPTSRPEKQKHVVFFMIDDYGFADASYKSTMYNGTAPPPTPAIDALAMNGIRLESHYVNKLCSPTRTAMLSGRYAYTIGMDDGVIIDGQNIDLPLNLETIADRLKHGGWKTSAYGKWDAGMTTWGSTPTCRGFDHFEGFYSAASHYFTHSVGAGYDYHDDFDSDNGAMGVYTTHKVTTDVIEWITKEVQDHAAAGAGAGAGAGDLGAADADQPHKKRAPLKTFAYVAHEAVHGPMEVPARYIAGSCAALVPADHPTRTIYCGMVRAMDESVKNISMAYEKLGIYTDTLFILTGDNGGIPQDGGSNFPLRGNKATTFEGGMRSIAFVSGAGIPQSMRGSISHELMHVTDWLPTIVGGIAGLSLLHNTTGRPCPTCTRTVAALDGVNQWPMLSVAGQPSGRTEVLLDMQTTALNKAALGNTVVPGSGAIRVGKWKLLHGHQGVWPGQCTLRQPKASVFPPTSFPIAILSNETNPWCPFGWTPPPRSDGKYEAPQPPPESAAWPNCTEGQLPCHVPPTSGYVAGQTMLFDVVTDMFERNNVAAQNPQVVAELLARLQTYNLTHCDGQRCMPDDAGGNKGKPSGRGGPDGAPVWVPWRGSPTPSACDTNRTDNTPPNPAATIRSNIRATFSQLKPAAAMTVGGWCWDSAFPGGGVPPMVVRLSVDGDVVVPFAVANTTRPGFMNATGAPNNQHGISVELPAAAAATLASTGLHKLSADVYVDQRPSSVQAATVPDRNSPVCFKSGVTHPCPKDPRAEEVVEPPLSVAENIDAWVFRN